MYTGAKLHLNVSDVLLWIRQHRHIISTDITKMYRQIGIHEDDWDLQRILWSDDQLHEVPYHLTTITYGTKAAPFLAVQTLLQLAEDEGHRLPLAVPSIIHGRYVDDIFGRTTTKGSRMSVKRFVPSWRLSSCQVACNSPRHHQCTHRYSRPRLTDHI